ncbi:MAG: hypothetical protein K2O18_14580 [Oscillospiraceae bacterium]|nr:hypothetical protein [Oscillospiraceae bacterium]
MKKYCRELKIHGIPTEAQIFTDTNGKEWVRMMAEGCWGPQSISKSDKHIFVHINKDKSISAAVQQLISAEKTADEHWLEEQLDCMLNAIESSLGLRSDSLTTASYWVSHSSKQLDDWMGEFEKAIVAGETVQALMEINTLANICGYFLIIAEFRNCAVTKPSTMDIIAVILCRRKAKTALAAVMHGHVLSAILLTAASVPPAKLNVKRADARNVSVKTIML